jgi:hypothetical protein
MNAQRRWVGILQPLAALLKFRLPWAAGKTDYLAGAVMLPVWGPPTTTESRLLVPSPELTAAVCKSFPPMIGVADGPSWTSKQSSAAMAINSANSALLSRGLAGSNVIWPCVSWDNTTYGEQLFYFNTDIRLRAYDHRCSDAYARTQTASVVARQTASLSCFAEISPANVEGSISTDVLTRKRPREHGQVADPDCSADRMCPLPFSAWTDVAQDMSCVAAHAPIDVVGLDHCFDCSIEVSILSSYLRLVWASNGTLSEPHFSSTLLHLSASLSTAISPYSGRSLTTQLHQSALRFPDYVSCVL